MKRVNFNKKMDEKNESTNGAIIASKTGIHNNRSDKIFKLRNSVFTDLFENKHFSSIRHSLIGTVILIFMYSCISDIESPGNLKLVLQYIIIGFGQFHKVILIWTLMCTATLLMYPAFFVWANIRLKLHLKLIHQLDQICLASFLIYLVGFIFLPPFYIQKNGLPIASATVIIMEQVRMIMKVHAYISTNGPRINSSKHHSEDGYFDIPGFHEYLYFLFVPTFIYKDEYPRTKEIRWSVVITHFIELGAYIVLCSFVGTNYILPTFKTFGLQPQSWSQICISILRMCLPAAIIVITGFYAVLHGWLNAWAEMLRFGDRIFYLDWWNSPSYAMFYRKENVVVHDYLHAFVYRQMYQLVPNKVLATCMVFWTSALIHEYILAFMLGGVFFPVLFVLFGVIGLVLVFLEHLTKDRQFIGNVFFWWSLLLGIGIVLSVYAMEYFARINCTKSYNSFRDYFLPHLLYCDNM